ncbi:hypothetical protein [Hoyosella subflava]|uniref:Uncharacterized protein n=1 Tax=Hoyosella subflava (strain DSM 45089 / JCM 17490 / NBRC 109087 / DQS3-9A1) TaxID=443218 RepID=F6ESK2_HOYSD|nr:hypothetical protein [Hoyosella subflava]AEF43125.1 hypothetical protein AS9A_P20081 [Hoyosella subflava DQS3-9A1]
MTTPLFPDCIIPGCTHPVTTFGDACTDCHTTFGPMLRDGGTPVTEEEIRERDDTTRAIYQHRTHMRRYRTTPDDGGLGMKPPHHHRHRL